MNGTAGNSLGARRIGEVVAEDYARAAVFKRLGIDFCCGGSGIPLPRGKALQRTVPDCRIRSRSSRKTTIAQAG